MRLLYDGSFDSLLTAFAYCFSQNLKPDEIVAADQAEPLLFSENFHAGCDLTVAEKFSQTVESISEKGLSHLCTAYLSESNGYEIASYKFLTALFEKGSSIINNLADERIRTMQQIVYKVSCEKHRMLGLLRFSELSDKSFYAAYEPDNNITALIAPHFSQRLPHDWIIHDLRRNIAAIKRRRRWDIFSIEQSSPVVYSDREQEYRSIWRRYYKEIPIPERKNPRCQRNFMPQRYWKHLTERQTG